MFYLAGDIGGTKTHLAIVEENVGKIETIEERIFPSRHYSNFYLIIKKFLKNNGLKIVKACFGIAGPIRDGKSRTTNLPWLIERETLKQELNITNVELINDLEANVYGLNMLKDEELYPINKGDPDVKGTLAMISIGTGLGEAGVFCDKKGYTPFPSEGGHADFAPADDLQYELFKFLKKKFGHVSCERILSGPGLYDLYLFMVETDKEKEDPETLKAIQTAHSPQLILEKGASGESRACKRTLDVFISIYGSEVGNLVLKILALRGVFLGGGLAPKILDRIKEEDFFSAFTNKGRFSKLLRSVPIWVVLNENAALLGAMYYAQHFM